jgi:hypothetical protein
MSNEINPYAAPETYNEPVLAGDNAAEQIRRAHINHEASVKSIGTLYLIGGIITLLGVCGLLVMVISQPGNVGIIELGLTMVYAGVSVLMLALSYGLYKLQPWTRIVGSILAGIGLLGFPIGTLINGYILWLLLSKKGSMVFSPEYKQIILATPHVKYKTSIVVWILLGLIVLLLAIAIFGAFSVRSPGPRAVPMGS